jgi:hypothetical protein
MMVTIQVDLQTLDVVRKLIYLAGRVGQAEQREEPRRCGCK